MVQVAHKTSSRAKTSKLDFCWSGCQHRVERHLIEGVRKTELAPGRLRPRHISGPRNYLAFCLLFSLLEEEMRSWQIPLENWNKASREDSSLNLSANFSACPLQLYFKGGGRHMTIELKNCLAITYFKSAKMKCYVIFHWYANYSSISVLWFESLQRRV